MAESVGTVAQCGWLCPACSSAHAPSVATCPVKQRAGAVTTITNFSSNVDPAADALRGAQRQLRNMMEAAKHG